MILRASPRCWQSGQVMPLTVLLILAVILALWILYESGTLMTEKIRLQNTADNVAYSSAALLARDLNFIAYTNRGMIANQVGIGQMVGLSSWAASMDQLAANIDTAANFFPPAKAFSSSLKGSTAGLSDSMDRFADYMIRANHQFSEALSDAQRIFHQSVILQLPDMAQDIAHRNDPDAYALLAIDGQPFVSAAEAAARWHEHIGEQNQRHPVDGADERQQQENARFRELQAMTHDSRDPFAANRSYEWREPFTTPRWPGGWQTQKYGGSDMIRFVDPDDGKYRWDWTAAETVAVRFVQCDLEGCDYEDPGIPLTWGAAHALDADKDGDFHDYGYVRERRSPDRWGHGIWRNPLPAYALLASPYTHETTGGRDHIHHRISDTHPLPRFYSFRSTEPLQVGPEISALYAKDARDIGFQRRLMHEASGTLSEPLDVQSQGGMARERLGALAKAQAYYMRPTDLPTFARADGRREHGNLFNPYWQPRLMDASAAEKAAAIARVSGLQLNPPEEASP